MKYELNLCLKGEDVVLGKVLVEQVPRIDEVLAFSGVTLHNIKSPSNVVLQVTGVEWVFDSSQYHFSYPLSNNCLSAPPHIVQPVNIIVEPLTIIELREE